MPPSGHWLDDGLVHTPGVSFAAVLEHLQALTFLEIQGHAAGGLAPLLGRISILSRLRSLAHHGHQARVS